MTDPKLSHRTPFNLTESNQRIGALCAFVEECKALSTVFHGYQNDPADLDIEGCFV